MPSIETTMQQEFPSLDLRAGQQQVITHILSEGQNSDILCTFPTGYGKSLCYIIPAHVLAAPCIVVSPLCSLIQDQCTKLNSRPDAPQRAFNLSSSCADSAAEELALEQALAGPPRVVLLFCTPERLCFASFSQKLKDWHTARPFAYIVVDEAHLVAEQGHTFRPDYLRLGELRSHLPDVRVLCFSATCNAFVRGCLEKVLRFRNLTVFTHDTSTTERKPVTVRLHVRTKRGTCRCATPGCLWASAGDEAVLDTARGTAPGEILVFSSSRASCERLCAAFRANSSTETIEVYHGGLDDDERTAIQARFFNKEIDVLVCTMASFGTGVDMPGVRRVVLHGVPSSVHLLVQLVGRGGRDGLPWTVDVFCTPADLVKNRALFDKESSQWKGEYLRFAIDALEMVEAFVRGDCCLEALLLRSKHARSTPLQFSFDRLAEFKRLHRGRARWSKGLRQWYVPALGRVEGLEAWMRRGGAVQGQSDDDVENCGRCSVCAAAPPRVVPCKRAAGAEA